MRNSNAPTISIMQRNSDVIKTLLFEQLNNVIVAQWENITMTNENET